MLLAGELSLQTSATAPTQVPATTSALALVSSPAPAPVSSSGSAPALASTSTPTLAPRQCSSSSLHYSSRVMVDVATPVPVPSNTSPFQAILGDGGLLWPIRGFQMGSVIDKGSLHTYQVLKPSAWGSLLSGSAWPSFALLIISPVSWFGFGFHPHL